MLPPPSPNILIQTHPIFDTQISHEQHGQDKQFSPWIKKHVKQMINLPTRKDKEKDVNKKDKSTLEFLAIIKSKKLCKTVDLGVDDVEVKTEHVNKEEQELRKRAENRFQEVFTRNIRNRAESLRIKTKFNPVLKQVNLRLDCETSLPNTIYRSLQHRPQNMKQHLLTRKSKRSSISQQRSISQTSESNRYNILKTRQVFYNTLQINLPIASKRKIPQVISQKQKRKSSHQNQNISLSFPVRPKPIASRNFKFPDEHAMQQEYNLMGEGVIFSTAERIRSRRDKIRDHFQHQDLESNAKIFLQ